MQPLPGVTTQESICAAESLQFIAAVLNSARPRIEELIGAAYSSSGGAPPQLAQVASFYAQSVEAVPHLTEAIHRALVRKTLDLAQVGCCCCCCCCCFCVGVCLCVCLQPPVTTLLCNPWCHPSM
jgi:hypothetical protein